MKLYYYPLSCSFASHVALIESGMPFDAVRVDLAKKVTEHNEDFWQINPKGAVPALLLNNGELITECAVILQFIADQVPEKKLIPATGTTARYHLLEWLNYIASELQKSLGRFYMPFHCDADKNFEMESITKQLNYVNSKLSSNPSGFAFSNGFTVADAYLFTALNWCGFLKISLSAYPAIETYMTKIAAHPSVAKAIQIESK